MLPDMSASAESGLMHVARIRSSRAQTNAESLSLASIGASRDQADARLKSVRHLALAVPPPVAGRSSPEGAPEACVERRQVAETGGGCNISDSEARCS